MECYSALENKVLTHAAARMDLENITLNELDTGE